MDFLYYNLSHIYILVWIPYDGILAHLTKFYCNTAIAWYFPYSCSIFHTQRDPNMDPRGTLHFISTLLDLNPLCVTYWTHLRTPWIVFQSNKIIKSVKWFWKTKNITPIFHCLIDFICYSGKGLESHKGYLLALRMIWNNDLIYLYCRTSNIRRTSVCNTLVDYSDRRCSNYIFILDLTPNGLCKDNCKTRRETYNLVCLTPDVWRYIIFLIHAWTSAMNVSEYMIYIWRSLLKYSDRLGNSWKHSIWVHGIEGSRHGAIIFIFKEVDI